MFVRVTHGRYDVANEAEIQRMVEERLIPAMKQLPGFQSYLGGVDRSTGKLFAISAWETVEQSQAVDVHALRAPFGSLIQFEPAEVYEITVQA